MNLESFIIVVIGLVFILSGIIISTKMDKTINFKNDLRKSRLLEKRIVIFEKFKTLNQ